MLISGNSAVCQIEHREREDGLGSITVESTENEPIFKRLVNHRNSNEERERKKWSISSSVD